MENTLSYAGNMIVSFTGYGVIIIFIIHVPVHTTKLGATVKLLNRIYPFTVIGNFNFCTSVMAATLWAPSQYPKKRLFVRSRKVSKPRDWYFKLSYRFEIWQAHRQHCCRSACQISERSENSEYKSRGFETWRDLTKRRLFRYWDGALNA